MPHTALCKYRKTDIDVDSSRQYLAQSVVPLVPGFIGIVWSLSVIENTAGHGVRRGVELGSLCGPRQAYTQANEGSKVEAGSKPLIASWPSFISTSSCCSPQCSIMATTKNINRPSKNNMHIDLPQSMHMPPPPPPQKKILEVEVAALGNFYRVQLQTTCACTLSNCITNRTLLSKPHRSTISMQRPENCASNTFCIRRNS